MCIFCNNEVSMEEKEKYFIEKCNNCGGKVSILKKNNKIVLKYPKKDFIWNIFLMFPLFLIGIILLLLFGSNILNIKTEDIINIFLIGIIIMTVIMVFCSVINMKNFKKYGYMYSRLKVVVLKDDKKINLMFLKIINWFIIFFGFQFIIIMGIAIYTGILYK